MPRNPVRSGRTEQRARASTRRRGALIPRDLREPSGPLQRPLRDWIDAHQDALGFDRPARIDIGRYLYDTRHFDLDEDERLRWLGVSIELSCPAAEAWPAALRAYQYGLGRSADRVWLLNSIAITAYELADMLPDGEAKRAWAEGVRAGREAVALEPEEPDHRFALGLVLYNSRRTEEALATFRAGVALGDKGRCQLYAAHCLHDQERWAEALAAYEAVDLGQLPPKPIWRVDVLKEQRAECRFHAGQPEQAQAEVDAILERYGREPHLAWWAMSAALRRLAEALGDPYPDCIKDLDAAASEWDDQRFWRDDAEE